MNRTRNVIGGVVIGFGAWFSLFFRLDVGLVIAVAGAIILKPDLLDRITERRKKKIEGAES